MRRGLLTFGLMLLVLGSFALLVWQNAAPIAPIAPGLPTQAVPTDNPNLISELLRQGFGENSTPLPTIAIPTTNPFPTTTPAPLPTPTLISAAELSSGNPTQIAAVIATPTIPPPVLTQATDATAQAVTREPLAWQPPPLVPPISRDPLGRDHYWFQRPVDSNANNAVLSYYPYGSDGPDASNPLRVHHGIDMPNPVGEPVRAAGSGVVIWAADGRQEEVSIFQNSPSYGNVIVIEHDFGYQGNKLWTLYAHLSASFVQQGDAVAAGQVIGQVGNSGRVSGPHVHFEVRMGPENIYGATYNPVLWMVPYVGHGVIAGRIIDREGFPVMDADITIRSRATGLTVRTTTSYVILDTGFDVNSDPAWQENFAVPDIPVGRYDVIAMIYGERVIQQVQVLEGTTAFVEIKPVDPVTPQAQPTSGG